MSSVKETYTTAELAKVLAVHVSSIRRRAKVESWKIQQRAERLGGNTYPHESLPQDVKAAIARHEAAQVPQKVLDDAVIPDWSHRIGLARYQVVSEWRLYCQKQVGRGVKKAEAMEVFLAAYNCGQLCKGAFEVIGRVVKSSVYKWDQTLRENDENYYKICDKRGKWQQGGKKGLGQLSQEAAETFLSAWLTPNQPSVTMAYNVLETVMKRRGLKSHRSPPCTATPGVLRSSITTFTY